MLLPTVLVVLFVALEKNLDLVYFSDNIRLIERQERRRFSVLTEFGFTLYFVRH